MSHVLCIVTCSRQLILERPPPNGQSLYALALGKHQAASWFSSVYMYTPSLGRGSWVAPWVARTAETRPDCGVRARVESCHRGIEV